MSSIFLWLSKYEDFSKNYARACDERVEAMVEQSFEIADDGTNDWMEKHFGNDEESSWVVNGEAVQRSKLRIDTRKWYAGRMKPKKYGDKIDVTTDGEKLPTPITPLPIKVPK